MAEILWVPGDSFIELPLDAVMGGVNNEGSALFVGRVHHGGYYYPAKVYPTKRSAHIVHRGKELSTDQYDLLCGRRLQWVYSTNDCIPNTAYKCGENANGEALYVGRIHHNDSDVVGTVCSYNGCLYISYGGEQLVYEQYEILIQY